MQRVWYRIIEDNESRYFEKTNMQKFDFLKNGARFYAKITSPTCFPHKITPNRVIFEKFKKIKFLYFKSVQLGIRVKIASFIQEHILPIRDNNTYQDNSKV